MKYLSLNICILMMGMIMFFPSCEEDNEVTSTHTDASTSVVGTYTGTLTYETSSYTDAIVILTRIDADTTQAVTANIQSSSFASLNVTGKLNVAAANDEYLLSSGYSNTQKLSGRIAEEALTLKVPLTKSGTSLTNASTGKVWTFTGNKN